MVQGKMIRYVHIPDEVDAMQNLQKHVSIHPTATMGRPLRFFCRSLL